ncbi:MAG: hypothetical protein HQL93_03540 [Magnetococcales bacterium]|nr:hypothetical protein [Magnetococcales bacterium]
MKKHFVATVLWGLAFFLAGSGGAAEKMEQSPFTNTELEQFITDYPTFTQWSSKQNPMVDTMHGSWVLAGLRYNKDFITYLKEKKWDPERFFYMLNHINTGLLVNAAEKKQAEMKAQTEKNQQKSQQEMAASNQRMRAQMAVQQEQIRTNPYIHPAQKERILASMKTSSASLNAGPVSMNEQQNNWFNSQEQAIRNNPYMHPMQRNQALSQLQQARNAQKQNAAMPVAKSLTQEEMQSDMQQLHKQWYVNQKQSIEANVAIPPPQKKWMLDRLQEQEKYLKESTSRQSVAQPIIPGEEQSLINDNQSRLTDLFFKKKS